MRRFDHCTFCLHRNDAIVGVPGDISLHLLDLSFVYATVFATVPGPSKNSTFFKSDLRNLKNTATHFGSGGVHSDGIDALCLRECDCATGTGPIDSELPCLQASVEQINRPRSCGTKSAAYLKLMSNFQPQRECLPPVLIFFWVPPQ